MDRASLSVSGNTTPSLPHVCRLPSAVTIGRTVGEYLDSFNCKIHTMYNNDNNDNDKRLGLTAKADQTDHKNTVH